MHFEGWASPATHFLTAAASGRRPWLITSLMSVRPSSWTSHYAENMWPECLNEHWFLSLADARSKIDGWRRFYNEERPHRAPGWKTPKEFALKHGSQANSRVS